MECPEVPPNPPTAQPPQRANPERDQDENPHRISAFNSLYPQPEWEAQKNQLRLVLLCMTIYQ
jgi:hypothetical protein